MNLTDIDDTYGYYDPSEDELGQQHLEDLRKKKLTLRDINKLKKIRATRRLELLKRLDFLEIMYSIPDPNVGMGGGMGGPPMGGAPPPM